MRGQIYIPKTNCFEYNKLNIKIANHFQKIFIRKNSNYLFSMRKI